MEEPTFSEELSSKKRSAGFPALLVAGLAFLIPIFFLPIDGAVFQFSKVMLALLAVTVLFILFALNTFKTRSLSIPVSFTLFTLLALPFAFLASAFFSGHPQASLFGYQIDSDTFGFIALCVSLTVVVLLSIQHAKQVFAVLLGVLAAGVVVILFQAVQFFFGGVPVAYFDSPISNLIGGWNGLAVFFGLLATLALVSLESLSFTRVSGFVVNAALAISIGMLAIINFNVVWSLVALISFAVFVHALTRSFGRGGHGADIGMKGAAAGLVVIISLFFLFAGNGVALSLQNALNIQSLEVRPSVEGTVAVMQSVFAKSPVFGTGPNTFAFEWFESRPESIVATPFWDIAFSAGFGAIPSSVATGGAVLALMWLLVIGTLLSLVTKALLSAPEGNEQAYFVIVTTAVGTLYLLLVHLFYVPDQGLTLLMYLFIGLFLASLRGTRLSNELHITFAKSPRAGFFAVLVILLLSVASLVSLYGGSTVFASTMRSQDAVNRSLQGDFEGARTSILSALSLSEQDRYYRTLVAIELSRLSALVTEGSSDEVAQVKFRELLSNAINAGQRATDLDSKNYQNWLSRASVYASVVPLGIEGSGETAEEALKEARKYNPQTPEVDYRMAQIRLAINDADGATDFAQAALKKKADYTPAILLLAQVSFNEGRLSDAIDSVTSAVVLEPNNAQLIYQLGLLQLQAKRYTDAKTSFEQALAINPEYANASFFLGQAYVFLNRLTDALIQFKSLQEENPDNTTLTSVISALEAGENPFDVPVESPDDVKTPTN
ncbi:tetratricopeptide repeat protein [Patescibacteria group bacterium]|nr:tetratricopeptide repeat protein [Patescibacteria group bacterium]